jgi:hypothetical protein
MAAKVKRLGLEMPILTSLTYSKGRREASPYFVSSSVPSSNRMDISSIPSSVYLSRPVICPITQPDGHFVHPIICLFKPDEHFVHPIICLFKPDGHFVHPVNRLFKPDGHFMHPVIRLFKNRSMPIRVSLPAARSPPCLRVEAEKLSTIFKAFHPYVPSFIRPSVQSSVQSSIRFVMVCLSRQALRSGLRRDGERVEYRLLQQQEQQQQ